MNPETHTDPFICSKGWSRTDPPKKILAIRLQATGDVVITLPYLQHLRRHLPATVRLDLLTRKETADIPKHLELFDRVFTIGGARNFKRQVLYTLGLLPLLRWQGYDMVLDLQNSLISRMVMRSVRPEAWTVFDKYSPRAAGDRTRLTIEAAGFRVPGPDTTFRLKDPGRGPAILKDNGWDGSSRLVILNPAAAFPTRNWPMENYATFARLWLDQFPDTQFVALGTRFIAEKTRYLRKSLGASLIDLVGNTGPYDAFAVMQQISLVVSEDSGLMHMGWVSGIPTLALFGGTRSDWARPLGPHTRLLDSSDLPCGNCMLETCPFGTVPCMIRYTPERVLGEALRLVRTGREYECANLSK